MKYMIKNPLDNTVNFVDAPDITDLPLGATALTDEEWGKRHMIIPAENARTTRNKLIAECDWSVLTDAPLTTSQKTAWKAYRQALRDLSAQPDFPLVINWPVRP